MDDLKAYVRRVTAGEKLNRDEAREAFDIIMSGGATLAQIAGFLVALKMRGETVEEITGAASVMRQKATMVTAPRGAIDTCGTGGDGSGTFNISTCVAFVAAGGGVPVAKHGNRAVSSKSGSADVLRELGVNLELSPDAVATCLAEAGLGFLFAPAHHAAMRHVAPVRQELGVRTIFNLLGPLSNPAGTKCQLIGVFARDWIRPMAETLRNLGSDRVWVVHGSDGLDELTTTGASHVAALADGAVKTFDVTPADAGLATASADDLKGGDAKQNAAALRAVLQGEKGPYRDITLLNAAAAFIVAGKAETLAEGARLAEHSIDGGHALGALDRLVAVSNA